MSPHPAPGAQPRADDDLGACGAHLPDRLQGGGEALGLAPALPRRRRLAAPGANLAVGERLEPLDDVSVIDEAGAEEVREERGRRVAGYRDRRGHGAASIVPVVWNGGDALPRTSGRRPATGQALALGGAGREGARAANDRRYARGSGTGGQQADDTHAARQRGTGSIPRRSAAGGCQWREGYSSRRRDRVEASAGAAAITPVSRAAQSPDSNSLWKAASARRRPVSVRTTDLALLTGSEISPFS